MAPRLYFGYGSNLWLNQMANRCPGSTFVSVASLKDWKWIINVRGYANIIPSPGDVVYGMVYAITPPNEQHLDICEGVPYAYVKQMHEVEMLDGKVVEGLVYVDILRLKEGQIRQEYIARMDHGISDALEKGMPEWYIKKYLVPAIHRNKTIK